MFYFSFKDGSLKMVLIFSLMGILIFFLFHVLDIYHFKKNYSIFVLEIYVEYMLEPIHKTINYKICWNVRINFNKKEIGFV